MLDGELFDKLETVARATRGSQEPFGGIQLVLSGDFHQLPPVTRGHQPGKRRQAPPVRAELAWVSILTVNLPGHATWTLCTAACTHKHAAGAALLSRADLYEILVYQPCRARLTL